ncbi:MAG: SDR family oxidoreductase [Ignavibacteriales bacterium]|nr:SDR family oxidoreductase [Ignavibacteriales bacterium]
MDLGLRNKVAMVAGASKGLGFAVAKALAAEGAQISIASRQTASIQAAKTAIKQSANVEVFACAADVKSPEAIERWKNDTVREFGGIDLLFANSGGPPAGGFLSFDDKAWKEAIDLLLLSAVRLSRVVIPVMKQRGGGSILFSTSSSVKEPQENLVLSNVVRASVPALAKTLSREFAADGIRVNNLMPGRIDTDRVRELDEINAAKKKISLEEQRKLVKAAIPAGRYGTADEYSRAAVFLLSPAASYITGATLQVDGGYLRSVF